MYMFVYVFLKGRRHQFSTNFGSILASFWKASGSKSQKKDAQERYKKTAPKKELRDGEKVMQQWHRRGLGALKQFHRHPGPHPLPGPTHYEHSTACFGARWRI